MTLILLTLSLALGVAGVRRISSPRVPRFVIDAVHRNASLLAVAFLVVHIVTSLLDGYAPIRLLDVIVPFGSAYRPLWLGFGTVAFDLLIAVAVTSLLRRRLGYRIWRATHWVAYVSWPVAVLHGLGTGSDARTVWMLAITAGCVIVVVVAVAIRATAGWPQHARVRVGALAATVLVLGGMLIWLPSGPLAAGWARRAGTPIALLPRSATPVSLSAGFVSRAGSLRFGGSTASVTGIVRRAQVDDGLSEIHLALTVPGRRLSVFGIRIYGHALPGGGLQMTSSRVELGTPSDPHLYFGDVTRLSETQLSAVVSADGGSRLTLVTRLQLSPSSDQANGTLTVRPSGT